MCNLSGLPVLGSSQTHPACSVRCSEGGVKGYDPEFSPGSEGTAGSGSCPADPAKARLGWEQFISSHSSKLQMKQSEQENNWFLSFSRCESYQRDTRSPVLCRLFFFQLVWICCCISTNRGTLQADGEISATGVDILIPLFLPALQCRLGFALRFIFTISSFL